MKTLQDLQLEESDVYALLDSDEFELKKEGFIYKVVDSKSKQLLQALANISEPCERVNLVLEPVMASQIYVEEKKGEFSLDDIFSSWVDALYVFSQVVRGRTSFTYKGKKYVITACDVPQIWQKLAQLADEDVDDVSVVFAKFVLENTWVRRKD